MRDEGMSAFILPGGRTEKAVEEDRYSRVDALFQAAASLIDIISAIDASSVDIIWPTVTYKNSPAISAIGGSTNNGRRTQRIERGHRSAKSCD
jgi:hypothetical protein